MLRPVIVLCGPGNNGGDGFVTARHLCRSRLARSRRLARLARPSDRRSAASRGVVARGRPTIGPHVLDGAELVVDAIFGAGLSRALEGPAAETLAAAAGRKLPIIAIDVPSGLMGDTGEALGAAASGPDRYFLSQEAGASVVAGPAAVRRSCRRRHRHPALRA